MEGQATKGMGVDCVRFIAGVLNDLAGEEVLRPPLLPQDIGMHNPREAVRAMAYIARGFRPYEVLRNGEALEPADIIVVGPIGGGPSHGMIVGAQPNTIWHSTGEGVHFTGVGTLEITGVRIFRIFRYLEKHLWLR